MFILHLYFWSVLFLIVHIPNIKQNNSVYLVLWFGFRLAK